MRGDWLTGSVTVGGVELRVHRTGGDKPPVVLAHGITDSALCWARLARALEDDYAVVMYDARGHGLSAHPGSYSFAEHVGDLVGLVEALDLAAPVLLGHSMGGPHVAAVAATRPDLVRGLVLEDPHWPLQPEDPASYGIDSWRDGLAADRAKSLDDLLSAGRRDNPAWTDEDLEPWARAKLTLDPAVPTWLYSSTDINRWRAILRRVRCPTLLITGDARLDTVSVGPEGAQEARDLCPTLVVANIASAGHSIHRDQFAAYSATVKDFLARVAGAGAGGSAGPRARRGGRGPGGR